MAKSPIHKARIRALQEVNYHEFAAWLEVYVEMAERPTTDWRKWSPPISDVVTMLRERRWRELASVYPLSWSRPNDILEDVKNAIYQENDC